MAISSAFYHRLHLTWAHFIIMAYQYRMNINIDLFSLYLQSLPDRNLPYLRLPKISCASPFSHLTSKVNHTTSYALQPIGWDETL